MDSYELKVEKGIPYREEDPLNAIRIFIDAIELATPEQISEAYRHLGTCHEHLGDLDLAYCAYEEAVSLAKRERQKLEEIRGKCCLSSIHIKRGEYDIALQLANEAHVMLLSRSIVPCLPYDAARITHGLCKALKASGSPRSQVRVLARLEFTHLLKAYEKDASGLEKKLLLADWLSDVEYGWAPLGRILLPLEYAILSFGGLKVRKEQIKNGNR